MTHQLILDPALGISAGQFAAAWNDDPERCKLAAAQVATAATRSYDPTWAEMVNLIVPSIALGVAGNALYDLIKDVLIGAGVRRRTQIIRETRPDGSEVTIITIEEGMP